MNDSSLHVVIIGYVWPEPNSSAAGLNMQGIIKHCLNNQWQVTFLTAANESEHAPDLTTSGVKVQSVALNCDSFNDDITSLAPDIVIFDRFMTEEQFSWRVRQCCPNAVHVLNTEDLHSLREARHQAVKQQQSWQQASTNTPLAQREIAAILRSDLTLLISETEKALLEHHYHVPSSQLYHLPLMLTQTEVCATLPDFDQRAHFICIGNFRHAPNWDAVLQLQHLWPHIRAQLPHAELHIYGAYPPPKATALHNAKKGFMVKGWAEDANQVMREARVCLAPLRFGAGVKGKLINAMLNGTPSITTSIGAEGLATPQQWPGTVTDDDKAFCQAAVSLYTNPTNWSDAQRKSPAVLQQYFDKNKMTVGLTERLVHLHNNVAEHRSHHFLQSLCWHHSMRSTQYMSQWITAKNKLAAELGQ